MNKKIQIAIIAVVMGLIFAVGCYAGSVYIQQGSSKHPVLVAIVIVDGKVVVNSETGEHATIYTKLGQVVTLNSAQSHGNYEIITWIWSTNIKTAENGYSNIYYVSPHQIGNYTVWLAITDSMTNEIQVNVGLVVS